MGLPLARTRQPSSSGRGAAEDRGETRPSERRFPRREEFAVRHTRPDLRKNRGNARGAEPAISAGVVALPQHRSSGCDAIAEALHRRGHAALCGSARRTAGGGISMGLLIRKTASFTETTFIEG